MPQKEAEEMILALLCNGKAEERAKAWLDHVRVGPLCRVFQTTEITVRAKQFNAREDLK